MTKNAVIRSLLTRWGDYQVRALEGGGWSRRTVLGRVMDEGMVAASIRSTAGYNARGEPPGIASTTAAISELPELLRRVIVSRYTGTGTLKGRAVKLGIEEGTYRAAVDKAHRVLARQLLRDTAA